MIRRKIIFRADGNGSVGMGHFIRTLALAEMLKNDFACIFATQCPSEYQTYEIQKVCQDFFSLPEDNSHFETFLNELSGDEIVVLDNYYFDTEYQRRIKQQGCKLVCIDDMHNRHYIADAVINHAPGLHTEDFSCESYTTLCLGLEYVLLRKPFLNKLKQERKHRTTIERIAVCFGGADGCNYTEKVCREIIDSGFHGKVTAIIGSAYQFKESLQNVNENIAIKESLSAEHMAEEFWVNDFAVVPCSSVLFEALACRTPVITGAYTDNQRHIEHYFRKKTEIPVIAFNTTCITQNILRVTDNANINITDPQINLLNVFNKISMPNI